MESLAIAQIGAADEGGGAAAVAHRLMAGYVARGHRVWHLVGLKRGHDPDVVLLPDDDRAAFRLSGYGAMQSGLRRLAARFPDRGFGLVSRSLRLATHPRAVAARLAGLEDFEFPGSARSLDRLGAAPDIVHGHNLQGQYFDLRALSTISARVPTLLTLHDMWLLTGHCAHSLGCGRWQSGCGACPDLRLDPPIRRDATAENWRRKRDVFADSALHVITPSCWLRDRVSASQLAPFITSLRVVPNGVDTRVFSPGRRGAARAALGLEQDAALVLLTTGSRGSMWKDDRMLHDTVRRLSALQRARPIEFLAVGRETAVVPGTKTRSIPFQRDPHTMAMYFQAADIYLHAARADTFPLAVLEAMACGTPVIASSVGGIPEQIDDQRTGLLVSEKDSAHMAAAVERLLADDEQRLSMGRRAAAEIASRFTVDTQVDMYLSIYRELLEHSATQ